MKRDRREVIDQLIKNNSRFKKLFEQHRELDDQLELLDRRIYLTPEQQTEINRLKKLKLKNKDLMEAIVVQFENGIRGERRITREGAVSSA